jgi:HTH-type transcriptional regulator/antitoxin HigA
MEKVESYLQIATQKGGFHNLDPEQKADLQLLSKLAESWEDGIPLMPIPKPQTLVGMIELKMYERKLKQKDLAALLGISPTRLSEVLQSKRKINLDLAKRLYKILEIDPAFILETA